MASTMINPGTECPEHIIGKEKDEYMKKNESKNGLPVPPVIFDMQFRNGWNFGRDGHFLGGMKECPPGDLVDSKALEQPLPRLPVEPADIIEIFKMGIETFFKELKAGAGSE